ERAGDAVRPREVVLGALERIAKEMPVVPVVAAAAVRPFDLAIRGKTLFGIGTELRDVLEQHVHGREPPDEELQEERLARARLDRLEPRGERLPSLARDAVA